MARYRIGLKENIVGTQWYACDRKVLCTWIPVHSFATRQDCLRFANYLLTQGNFVEDVNLDARRRGEAVWTK